MAKNTCLRLYLAWLDHNHNAKIVGPAPAEWMGSLLSHSSSVLQMLILATKLASITSLSASRPGPAPQGSSLVRMRTFGEKYARRDWLSRVIVLGRSGGACFLMPRLSSTAAGFCFFPYLLFVVRLTWFVSGLPVNVGYLGLYIHMYKKKKKAKTIIHCFKDLQRQSGALCGRTLIGNICEVKMLLFELQKHYFNKSPICN